MDSNQRLPPCQGDTLPTELRGQKRNGSISKKSLNSKQILIFRKIPPKFYHLTLAEILYKISPRRKIPVEILREISRFCQNPHAEIPHEILSRSRGARAFRPSSLFCPALFYLVASFRPLASLRLAPIKTSKFSHSALEFLRFVASRPDRFVSCSRACRLVSAYLDRARSYRIRGGFLYKFCFF